MRLSLEKNAVIPHIKDYKAMLATKFQELGCFGFLLYFGIFFSV